MEEYTLYLDESEIPIVDEHKNVINRMFAIGGIALKNSYHDNEFTKSISEIKHKIWSETKYKNSYNNFILHEMEITSAHFKHFGQLKNDYNRIFASYSKYNLLYREISNIISNNEITTFCAYINQNELNRIYPCDSLNDKLSILMQIIIENYYHFLIFNKSFGSICYEYIDEGQNKIVKKRYDYIRQTGTMFYPAKKINSLIKTLYFKNKYDNVAGLQLADFVPNTLGRYKCNKENKSNINFNSVYSKLYDGGINMPEKFGLKEIP